MRPACIVACPREEVTLTPAIPRGLRQSSILGVLSTKREIATKATMLLLPRRSWLVLITTALLALISARAKRETPIIDAVVSFKNVRDSREFWIPFLEQWPPGLGDLYIVVDEKFGNSTDWANFKACLSATSYVPKLAVLPKEKRFLKDTDFFWKLSGFTKNHWKFWLDEIIPPDPNGDDRVIAIIDDDACLIDHFVPDDIVNPITGRLIAHGLHIDRHGYHLGEKDPKKRTELDSWARWTLAIGLPWWGNFMTDFPVFFWREMLPDLRRWMIEHGLRKTMPTDYDQVKSDFWKVYQKFFRDTPGHYCEFCLLLNYAYMDPKWRDRHDWRLAPTNVSLGMSLHQHTHWGVSGCPTREQLLHNKLYESLLYYPYNLRTRFTLRRSNSRPSSCRTMVLAADVHARVHGPLEARSAGERVDLGRRHGPDDEGQRSPTRGWTGTPSSAPPCGSPSTTRPERLHDGGRPPEWEAMLKAHQMRVYDWKSEEALSHVEVDPTMDKWRTCFKKGSRNKLSAA